MLEGIKTDHDCPECVCKLQYDITDNGDGTLTVNIYCENDLCDYYTWTYIDPIAKEIT